MDRRDFIKVAGASVPFALAPSTSHAIWGTVAQYRQAVPEIFANVPRPPAYTPALVIGSGFGGAITALRLAQAGIQTTVLERGFRWPVSAKRQTFSPDMFPDGRGYWYRTSFEQITGLTSFMDSFGGVFDCVDYDNISVWRGACVGGGSVVFTGVMIQPERRYFDAIFNGLISYDELDRVYYPRVRQMLRLSAMPNDIYQSAPFGHSRIWDTHARKAGYTPVANDSIFNWDVVRGELKGSYRPSAILGESNLGNSDGAKYDLTQNYLKLAEQTGKATIYPAHEVKNVYFDGTRYSVDVIKRSPDGKQLDRYTLTCDKLFLAAGSIGTSEILVRARALNHIPNLNEHVGEGWGTNGDVAAVRTFGALKGMTQGSPSASRIIDTSGMPTTLESWYVPSLGVNLGMNASLGLAFDLKNRASFRYDGSRDRVNLLWPKNGNDDAIAAVRHVNNKIAAASGTIPGAWPVAPDCNASWTAHPLGGAVLGRATDAYGRVIGPKNLYVMDGAMIPGTTGAVNPSLTISALAERNIEAILKQDF